MKKRATAALQKQGVELVLNDRVISHSDTVVHLRSQETIICDMFFEGFICGVNSTFMPTETLNQYGYIKVDEYLRVEGMMNVFE